MHKKTIFWSILATLYCFSPLISEEFEFTFDQNSFKKVNEIKEDMPVPMANLEGEPSAFVHDCVNVISGQYCDFETDLVVHHAIDPLVLERSFAGSNETSGPLGVGWHLNHSSALIYKLGGIKDDEHNLDFVAGLFRDDHGVGGLIFNARGFGDFAHKKCFDKGVTNCSHGCISGQTDLRNTTCILQDGKNIVTTGSKRIREYKIPKKNKSGTYHLCKEIKPTGNQYHYHHSYYDHRAHMDRIELTNQRGNSAGYLQFGKCKRKELLKGKPLTITTQDGRWVKYNYDKDSFKRLLLETVERSDGPKQEYIYEDFYIGDTVLNSIGMKILPDKRYLSIAYYEEGRNSVMNYNVPLNGSDPRLYRVNKLRAPAGTDSNSVPIYQFLYDLAVVKNTKTDVQEVKQGSCTVFNALGDKTQYGFDVNHRLTAINKFHKSGQVYTHEQLIWGDNDSKDNACLLARQLFEGSCVFAHTYQYDDAGNILIDALYGNLSGRNTTPPCIMPNGAAFGNGCECYCKLQNYSNDGFNLLIGEYDGVKSTVYLYAPGTNRLIAKYQGNLEKILRRHFYEYNEDAALIKEIIDDGCELHADNLAGATERRMTYYTPSQVYPVGYPLIIEEKCLDLATGQELLIHKVVNTYTNQAKISQQDHYNSEGNLAYCLAWEFDNMGNVIKEMDPIGRFTTRRFDANGNCIFTQGANNDCHKVFTYDFMNRLIKEEEIHTDGIRHSISNRYDVASNKIASVDRNGNETLFIHDAFGRVIETLYPAVLNEHQIPCFPSVKKAYDPMSNVTSEINARGIEKKMAYNIRGQLTEIQYPDGTTEKNTYNLNGTLKESKAKNNTITRYTYDPLDRPIKTEIYSANEELLSTSITIYSGFHVLTEIDPEGVETHYTYFPNGKLKSKQKGSFKTLYFYDALGRQNKTIEQYGPNDNDAIIKCQTFDVINRLTEEKVLDSNHTIIIKKDYVYDISDNICQITSYNQQGSSTTRTQYDSHGVPIITVDAEGNATITKVRYDHRNKFGQIVPCKEVIDPLGNVEISISDVFERPVTTVRGNAFGKLTQKQEKTYDLKGNLFSIVDTVISHESNQSITSLMFYDSSDRLTACYEAFLTPDQKQTKITYNIFGQKENLIKNDGTILSHAYDAMGRLESLRSSDGNIHYCYHYDRNGNPIKTDDVINKTSTIRQYDVLGHLCKEELANQLPLAYQNDNVGRTTRITLPDESTISYGYRSILLENIQRFDKLGTPLYTHQYKSYDQTGQVTEALLLGPAGSMTHSYDRLRRLKQTTSNNWKEEILNYDKVGNILTCSLTDSLGEVTSSYSYDDLYQITSEKGKTTHSYSYDSHYNRRIKDGRFHRLNSLHQLLDDGKYTYSYDHNGNLTEKKSKDYTCSFIYDALDRLTTFCQDDQKVCYSYDDNNRRLSKTYFTLEANNQWKQQNTVLFLYQGQNEIGAADKQGNIIELRVLGVGKGAEIGAAIAMELSNKVYVPIHDHIGNVACLLDGATGEVVETYRYSSFGEELFDDALSPWRFASKRVDEESGLIYFGRRYYDPEIGRWMTPDPIGREGGPNLYAYVLNHPLTQFDLYGLFGIANSGRSPFNNFMSRIGGYLEYALQFPGKVFSLISHHLIPIPYVKDVLEFGGWCLQGKNPTKFGWKKNGSKLLVHRGNGHGNPSFRHVLFSGACVSEHEGTSRLAKYSADYGGVTVYGMYNSTNGILLDGLEVLCQKIGIPVHAQRVAEKEMRKLASEMGEGGMFLAEAHSQGAETVHNLSSNVKRSMNVRAFGPARVLHNRDFQSADNYIQGFDPVPLLDPTGLIKGIRNGNVHYLPTSGCPLIDHCYDNSGFKEIRQSMGIRFQEKYMRP